LKLVDSPYTSNNNVIFYDDGKAVKRTTHLAQLHRVVNKIKDGMDDLLDDESIPEFTDYIYRKFSIS
jgi:hypothetical protein